MNDYAPQYTKEEKYAIVLKGVLVLLPFFLFLILGGYEWMREYFQDTCRLVNEFATTRLIIYGGLVVLPGGVCLATAMLFGPRAVKMLKTGQMPLPGEKVLAPTRYKYGRPVRIRAALLLLLLAALLILPFGLAHTAKEMVTSIETNMSELLKSCS